MNTSVSKFKTKTANVVALTAEVRALMVGSRQITLSVFAQLDEVDYDDLEIMGRVRPKCNGYWVVGKAADGSLVRANLKDSVRLSELESMCGIGDYLHTLFEEKELAQAREDGWKVEHISGAIQRTIETSPSMEELDEAPAKKQQMVNEYLCLPLIVLAGLK